MSEWDFLSEYDSILLARYLRNEYPQTVAIVLSNIPAEKRGEIVSMMPENFTMEVLMRMSRMERVTDTVLEKIKTVMQKELARYKDQPDNMEILRETFSNMDVNTRARYSAAMMERNREVALQVTKNYVTVHNAQYLSRENIETIINKSDRKQLFLALLGANDEVREAFMEFLPELSLIRGMTVMGIDQSMEYLAHLIEENP